MRNHEIITCSISTIWCVLSGLENPQSKVYPLPFGSLHIPWNLSITTSINEIQATAIGQVTWKLFHPQLICDKCKTPSKELRVIICMPKPPTRTSSYEKNCKLEGVASSYIYGICIYTHFNYWCHLFHG